MRPEILKILLRRRVKHEDTSSISIMGELAVEFDQFPNFLYRGISRKTQNRILRFFNEEMQLLWRVMLANRRGCDSRVLLQQCALEEEDCSSLDDTTVDRQ